MYAENVVLTAGNWRGGVDRLYVAKIEEINKRHAAGFRLLPQEEHVPGLTGMLDAYDELVEELLTSGSTL